ncbi:hypothetical protein GIB67_034748, partial [Kingdonia uniflora]
YEDSSKPYIVTFIIKADNGHIIKPINRTIVLDFPSIPALLFWFTSTHVNRSYRYNWLCSIIIPS